MPNGLMSIAKSIQSLKTSTERDALKFREQLRRAPFSIEMLTSAEIEEIERLIAHCDDAHRYAEERVETGGEKLRGMYLEFSKLGLTVNLADGLPMNVNPTAWWVVEKRRQRDAEAEAERKHRWAHDRNMAILSAGLGGLMGILGVITGFFLDRLIG